MRCQVVRRGIGAALIGGFVLGIAVFAQMLWFEFDDASIPSAAQSHLPSGVEPTSQSMACGSGGCSLSLTFDSDALPATTIDELLAMHGECEAVSTFNRRKVCAWIDKDDDAVLRMSFTYERPLGL